MSLTFKPPSFLHPFTPTQKPNPKTQPKTLCLTNNPTSSTSHLNTELTTEIQKLKTQTQDKQKAMTQSKHLLFSDFCTHLNLTSDDLIIKWKNSSDDDKLQLIKDFVSHWGLSFHPLSSKSVKDLVDEYVVVDCLEFQRSDLLKEDGGKNDEKGVLFPNLRKLFMGFSSDTY